MSFVPLCVCALRRRGAFVFGIGFLLDIPAL